MAAKMEKRIADLFSEQEGTPLGETIVRGLVCHSNRAAPDKIFFAFPPAQAGSSNAGISYVGRVAAAAYVVAEDDRRLAPELEARIIRVANPRQAYAEASCRFWNHPAAQLRIVGVTGTNGKTTVTQLIEFILSRCGIRTGLIGTVEYRFEGWHAPATHTTPEAFELQGMLRIFADAGAKAVAMEVSSHAIDQFRTWGIPFETLIFTNLSQDHLDYHASMKNYFDAKSTLFTDYKTKTRLICADDEWGHKLQNLCINRQIPFWTYGLSGQELNTALLRFDFKGIAGSLQIALPGQPIQALSIEAPLLGSFNGLNITAAIGAAFSLNCPTESVIAAVAALPQVPGRMERVPNPHGLTVLVDYAHTPDALEKALLTCRPLTKEKLYCVFGCGGERDRTKRPLMGKIAALLADHVVVTSDNPRSEDPSIIIEEICAGLSPDTMEQKRIAIQPNRHLAIAAAVAILQPGDVLLIAGKGHERTQEIAGQKLPFSDVDVAASCIANRFQEGPAHAHS